MHIPWSEVELFVAIAESGSLSGAAKRLRVTQPTISRRLVTLEAELSEPLFVRTAAGASMTSLGERMLEPARRMLDSAREVDLVAADAETGPRGVVRVTAPPAVAFDLLAPFALVVRKALPDVRLEINSAVNYLDLGRREADLGIRVKPPAMQRDLLTVATVVQGVAAYATPEYVARLPRRYGISDVDWICWAPPLEHLSPNPELAARLPDFRPVFASDDFLVQLRAAEAGVGAIVLGRFRSRLALPTRLVKMHLDLDGGTSPLHLVCARRSLAIPRVKAVLDLLVRELSQSTKSRKRSRCGLGAS